MREFFLNPLFKPLIGTLIGITFTPIALALAFVSTGAGHGNYILAKILYPFSALIMLQVNDPRARNELFFPALFVALCQFPIYGLIIGIPRTWERNVVLALFVFAGHAFVCYTAPLHYFGR